MMITTWKIFYLRIKLCQEKQWTLNWKQIWPSNRSVSGHFCVVSGQISNLEKQCRNVPEIQNKILNEKLLLDKMITPSMNRIMFHGFQFILESSSSADNGIWCLFYISTRVLWSSIETQLKCWSGPGVSLFSSDPIAVQCTFILQTLHCAACAVWSQFSGFSCSFIHNFLMFCIIYFCSITPWQ